MSDCMLRIEEIVAEEMKKLRKSIEKTLKLTLNDHRQNEEVTRLKEEVVSLKEEVASLKEVISRLETEKKEEEVVEMKIDAAHARSCSGSAKAASKRRAKNSNRAPSGFTIPVEISKELATFLGKPAGTKMKRTEVTREINQYIREHKLQDPVNGRRILPDAKLRTLLKVGDSDELTYFNFQRFMSPHFTKKS